MKSAIQATVFTCGVVIVAAPVFGSESIDAANSTRLERCAASSAGIARLHPDPRLDEAAQQLAGGQDLEAATSGAGYRAKVSASIHVSTSRGRTGIEAMLAERFCGILGDPELSDIGAFQRGDDTWLVLAGPLIPAGSADAIRSRVLELINEARRQPRRCGRKQYPAAPPLASNAELERAAIAHARDMASRGRLGHEGSDGSLPADRATRAGYRWKAVAENVAAGQSSAEEVVDTWLESAGHCENLMSPRYSETGIAHAVNRDAEKGIYWVQLFAAPR